MDSQTKKYIGPVGSSAQELLSPWSWDVSPTQKLPDAIPWVFFMEASSCRHNQLLTHFPTPLSSLKDSGGHGAESFKVLIMAWSVS